MPSPPRHLPAPQLSGTSAYSSTRTGCCDSHGLNRCIRQVLRRVGDGLDAVLVRPAAPSAADHVDNDKRFAVILVTGEGDDRIAAPRPPPAPCRAQPAPARRTSHRPRDTRQRARRACRRDLRIHDRRFRRDHLDCPEHAGIVRDIALEHAAHRQIGAGICIGFGGIQCRRHLRCGTFIIDRDTVAPHRDCDRDGQRRVGEAVIVDIVGKAIDAIGPFAISSRVIRSA